MQCAARPLPRANARAPCLSKLKHPGEKIVGENSVNIMESEVVRLGDAAGDSNLFSV